MGNEHLIAEARAENRLERRRPDPCAGFQLKPKLSLGTEFVTPSATHLEPVATTTEAPRFNVLDILGIPPMSYLKPIGESFGHAVRAETVPLPPLTNYNLDHLIVWKREFHGGGYPDSHCTKSVVVYSPQHQKFMDTGKTWADVRKALKDGTHGVEARYDTIAAYMKSRKPELTKESLLELLQSTRDHEGGRFSYNAVLWQKDTDDRTRWVPSLYTLTEINIILQKSPESFGAPTISAFRKLHGFPPRGKVDINYGYNESVVPK